MNNINGIIVTYHYINDATSGFLSKFHKLTTLQLKKQINYFREKNYNFIEMNDYVDFLYDKKEIENNFCILTFDDGLADHYNYVFPILKEFDIRGHFFPLPKSIEGETLPVHQTHALLAKLDDWEFASEINKNLKLLSPENFEKFKIDEIKKENLDNKDRIEAKYKMDGILRTNLKYNIAAMDYGLKEAILNKIFGQHFNESAFAREFYLNEEQMRKMAQDGMTFGAHSLTHPRLGLLNEQDQQKEIESSQKILENILRKKADTLSYPYGSYNATTIEVLKRLGFRAGLTIKEQRVDKLTLPFEINRFDANNFIT